MLTRAFGSTRSAFCPGCFVKNFLPPVTSMTMPSRCACRIGTDASKRPARWWSAARSSSRARSRKRAFRFSSAAAIDRTRLPTRRTRHSPSPSHCPASRSSASSGRSARTAATAPATGSVSMFMTAHPRGTRSRTAASTQSVCAAYSEPRSASLVHEASRLCPSRCSQAGAAAAASISARWSPVGSAARHNWSRMLSPVTTASSQPPQTVPRLAVVPEPAWRAPSPGSAGPPRRRAGRLVGQLGRPSRRTGRAWRRPRRGRPRAASGGGRRGGPTISQLSAVRALSVRVFAGEKISALSGSGPWPRSSHDDLSRTGTNPSTAWATA
jgi:hypothetical protein